MFSAEQLENIDPRYFNIITTDVYNVTIMRRNTGHIWYIHNSEYLGEGSCIIFHKHRASELYHQHGKSRTLRQALKNIQKHDQWQMGGRKRRK
ncbi:hypothetical protein [Robinsoniella peoriensis]|uniref:hypothetical protein n=1 Tax=Robinsoniella peoriensis TaxID=180332 RepID=UPI003750E986